MGLRPRTQPPQTEREQTLRNVIYIGLVVLVFGQAGLWAASSNAAKSQSTTLQTESGWKPKFLGKQTEHKPHPIATLMADAEAKYRATLARQSTSLKEAVRVYQTRHSGRNPPKGFDKWWQFVTDHGVLLVDEFDSVSEDLEPFWQLTGEEFRARVKEAGKYSSIDWVRLKNGNYTAVNPRDDGSGTSGRAAGFIAMLNALPEDLPDMDFALNSRVEPRVLIPWTPLNTTPPLTTNEAQYIPDWRGEGSIWDAFRRHCPPHTSARSLYRSLRPAKGGSRGPLLSTSFGPQAGPFARHTMATTNFCSSPSAHTLHGMFFSDWRPIPSLLPVISPSTAPGFNDIRVPSHYYYWPSRRHTYGFDAVNLVVRESDAREIPWEKKTDKIWWRGPSTGGGGSPGGYQERYQRHRLVTLAAENETVHQRTVTFPDPNSPAGKLRSASVPINQLNADTFDLAFTRISGEDNWPGGAENMRKAFPFEVDGTALGARWTSKYALDVDGAGYSGVFLALMESDSAVLKSTLFREFWSNWAVPWLHYIPLSAGYAEVYDLHAYFSGPGKATKRVAGIPEHVDEDKASTEGDRRLRRIARASKNWRRTVSRSVDMEAYVYRLVLEYARLWADDRTSMDFVL